MYIQKIEGDKQIAELENNASKLQETIDGLQEKIDDISDTTSDDNDIVEKNDEEKTIVETPYNWIEFKKD